MRSVSHFNCPNCAQSYEAEGDVGPSFECQKCGYAFTPAAEKTIMAQPEVAHDVIVTTGNDVSGRAVHAYIGIARGVVVRSPTSGQSIFGGVEKFFGGDNSAYAEVCESARRDAFTRMVDHAKLLRADAVIAFRYDATEFAPGVTEVLAYGTAVKLRA